MKASELIAEVQKLVEQYGDKDVVESYDGRDIARVEMTDYTDATGTHDVIGLELVED